MDRLHNVQPGPVTADSGINVSKCLPVSRKRIHGCTYSTFQEYVTIGVYSVSILALIPAIVIFFSYKTLRVQRIAIHKNLFGSLLMHCIVMVKQSNCDFNLCTL